MVKLRNEVRVIANSQAQEAQSMSDLERMIGYLLHQFRI